MYSATNDLCWKFWGVLDTMETNMADNSSGGNRTHASSPNELSPPCNTFTSRLMSRARSQHRKDYANHCSFVPVLLLLTLVTGLAKLPHYRSQPVAAPLGHCSLLVEDLSAHRPQNSTLWVPYHQDVVRGIEYMPSHQPEHDGIQPLSQLVSDSMTTVPSLALAVKKCVQPAASPTAATKRSSLGLLVIILSGDVHSNPGPIKYPCHACQRPVANNHRAMGCESCGIWVHIKCGGVTPKQYEAYLQGEGLSDWSCPACNAPADNTNSSSDNESFNLSDSTNSTPKSLSNQNEKAGHGHNVIKVAVINTSGISSRAKSGEFKAYINVENPDVIVACETNITPDMVDSDFLPSNYTAIRDDKCGSKGEGIFKHGVFIAHRNNLVVSEVAVIDKTTECVLARKT